MFIKVKPGMWVNTDRVNAVEINGNGEDATALLNMSNGGNLQISATALAHLLSMVEADSAVRLPGEQEAFDPSTLSPESVKHYNRWKAEKLTENCPPARPLTSRIAQALRDDFATGAPIERLMEFFKLNYFEVHEALDLLIAERVALEDPPMSGFYFHASHKPVKAAQTEVDLLITPDGMKNENFNTLTSAIRDGEFQCVECSAQSCPTCVTANACCKCNCPNFTPRAKGFFVTCPRCQSTDGEDNCAACGYPAPDTRVTSLAEQVIGEQLPLSKASSAEVIAAWEAEKGNADREARIKALRGRLLALGVELDMMLATKNCF